MNNITSLIFAAGIAAVVTGCTAVDSCKNAKHESWSNNIFQATLNLNAIPPITATAGREISVDEAYRIQSLYNDKMIKKFGKPVGYKVAYASKASQEKWGINAPTFGTFFEKQHVANGGQVAADSFILFHNESEVAFTIAEDITKPIENVEQLMPYLKSVHVGLDVPDNRFDKSKGPVKVADVIAMSCATHTFVIGDGVDPASVDYSQMTLSLDYNGVTVYSGAASNVMGDPREAVLILVKHLISQGTHLKKGDVVLTGSVAPAYCPKKIEDVKGVYVGKADGLPTVQLKLN